MKMMIKQTKLADDSDLQICCCLEHRRDYRSLLSSVYENAIISVYVDLYLINPSCEILAVHLRQWHVLRVSSGDGGAVGDV